MNINDLLRALMQQQSPAGPMTGGTAYPPQALHPFDPAKMPPQQMQPQPGPLDQFSMQDPRIRPMLPDKPYKLQDALRAAGVRERPAESEREYIPSPPATMTPDQRGNPVYVGDTPVKPQQGYDPLSSIMARQPQPNMLGPREANIGIPPRNGPPAAPLGNRLESIPPEQMPGGNMLGKPPELRGMQVGLGAGGVASATPIPSAGSAMASNDLGMQPPMPQQAPQQGGGLRGFLSGGTGIIPALVNRDGEMLGDILSGWGVGDSMQNSIGKGSLVAAQGRMTRKEKAAAKENENQTVAFLRAQGMDPDQAKFVASNPPALQAYLSQHYGGGAKPTDDMREFDLAREQGYGGSFMDYQRDVKGASATRVNVSTGGDDKFEGKNAQPGTGARAHRTSDAIDVDGNWWCAASGDRGTRCRRPGAWRPCDRGCSVRRRVWRCLRWRFRQRDRGPAN